MKEKPIKLSGKVSYVEQQCWNRPMSVRKNIILNEQFNKDKYINTILACELYNDFLRLDAGDCTKVSERGVSLSGGQKARISLARSIYTEADIYLLDDPISALDPIVRHKIYDKCLCQLLKGKTRILITHSVDMIKKADRVMVFQEGKVTSFGTLNEVISNEYI